MDCSSVQSTLLFILLAFSVGQGDGRWKKSNREMLQHDVKLFEKMTEKIKEELGAYYEDFSDEHFADYFIEEIDYMQSKIERNMNRKIKERRKEINYSNDDLNNVNIPTHRFTKNAGKNNQASAKNVTLQITNKKFEWPSFEDILTEMGKKYDWKNDRWIKVKAKIKDKNYTTSTNPKNNIVHIKHNFRYRIVKLNRAKSKRNVVVAVTAVR